MFQQWLRDNAAEFVCRLLNVLLCVVEVDGGLLPYSLRRTAVLFGFLAGFAALSAACLAVSPDASWIVYVPALCLLGIVAAGVTAYAAVGSAPAMMAFLAVLLFVTDGNFRLRPDGFTGLDWQGLLKLGVWIASGVIGLANLPRIGRVLNDWGATLWLAYICVALLSVSYAPAPAFSLGYAFSLLCLFGFAFAVVDRLSEKQVLWTITLTLAVFLVVSWVVVYADPEMGVSQERVAAHLEPRMSGIGGQANFLGTVCAMFLGTTFLLAWQRHCRLIPALSLAALGLVTLVATDSRTSYFGIAAGLLAVIFSRSPWFLAGIGLLAALSLAGAVSFPLPLDSLASHFSRSGDASEALTLTGRTQIWEFTWHKILESPLLGWGYNSSKLILGEHIGFSNDLSVDQAHNILLQNLLSVGIIGTLPVVGLFLKLLIDIVRGRPAPFSVLFLVMAFVTGIADPAALGTTPTDLTLMFMLATLCPWARANPAHSDSSREPARYAQSDDDLDRGLQPGQPA